MAKKAKKDADKKKTKKEEALVEEEEEEEIEDEEDLDLEDLDLEEDEEDEEGDDEEDEEDDEDEEDEEEVEPPKKPSKKADKKADKKEKKTDKKEPAKRKSPTPEGVKPPMLQDIPEGALSTADVSAMCNVEPRKLRMVLREQFYPDNGSKRYYWMPGSKELNEILDYFGVKPAKEEKKAGKKKTKK